MDTSKLHSVEVLLDCRATGSLIDRDFVRSKEMNTRTLSYNIPVFNVDSSSNKAEQISKVVDVVLWYKTHSKKDAPGRLRTWETESNSRLRLAQEPQLQDRLKERLK